MEGKEKREGRKGKKKKGDREDDKQDARNLLWPRTKTSGRVCFILLHLSDILFSFPKWKRFSHANRVIFKFVVIDKGDCSASWKMYNRNIRIYS